MFSFMFKLNKLMFLILKTGLIVIITNLIINYKYYKIIIIAVIIITYKLFLLIIVFNIVNSCLKLL